MTPRPKAAWSRYRNSIGDRSGMFGALARAWAPERALYPGSYVDLSPSTVIPAVTYVDTDRRAEAFFGDVDLVRAELHGRTVPGAGTEVEFLAADYTTALAVPDQGFDLLISLYAGPVWENCRRYLKPGGLLLANASHGDASLAALDPTLRLEAAVTHRGETYLLDTDRLDRYLVPKNPDGNRPELIRAAGRGVGYTRPAFAYVFAYAPAGNPGAAPPTGG
ncbi:class I SAM-dependent methyltransferase [Arthrobacter sp. PAMC25284]|uniref:class I SAM-dependent methyltransferase n=1 Tax=Arthrobacter sp. PAMC25284 TaxID=2861279 RepID=UPI001C634855|nr:class I SAM-dependent methyltransferase [Arthrobacter sp. PAMC25284]QYF90560.1 class I SAM-dependent methyltransferase [Arthrobacter sp. PAMC25284]